jgi:O-antigen/teichoic acid export membrane protein
MTESPSPDTTPCTPAAPGGAAPEPGPGGFAPVSRRSATVINLIFQNASVVLTVARGILIVPLYLHYINDGLYGAWLASGNVIIWISLSQGGFSYLLRQQTAELYGRGDRAQLGQAIGSGLAITAALSAVAFTLVFVVSPFCAGWFGLTGSDAGQLTWSFFFAGLAMGSSLIAGGFQSVQQGFQRHGGIGAVSLIAEAGSLLFSVVLVIAGWGLLSIGLSFLLRDLINLVAMAMLFRRSVRELAIPVRFERHTARRMLGLTGWTFLNYAGEWIFKSCDAFFVALLLGNRYATVTELTKRAWDVLSIVLCRLSFSFQPGLAHVHGGGDSQKFRAVMDQVLTVVGVSLGIGAGVAWALNEPFMALWVGADKFAGTWYNDLWGVAAGCNVLAFSLGQVLIAAANIRGSAIAQSVANLSRAVILVLLLLPGKLGWLPASVVVLAVPVSTLLAAGAVNAPLLLREWRGTLGLSPRQVGAQLWCPGRALLVAFGLAYLCRWLPVAKTWPRLVLRGVELTGVLVIAACLVDAAFRDIAWRMAGGVVGRLRGRRAGVP